MTIIHKPVQLFEVWIDDTIYSLFAYSRDGALRKAQKHFPNANKVEVV